MLSAVGRPPGETVDVLAHIDGDFQVCAGRPSRAEGGSELPEGPTAPAINARSFLTATSTTMRICR